MEFDDSLITDVLEHADIAKIIGSFIPVIKVGRSYKAKCPFHDDTSPSMMISPEKKIFKCFVCGHGGSAISFVQQYLHISFFEAMKKVAELSGYSDPRLEKNVAKKASDPKREPLLKCLHDLTLYYQYALSTPEGKEGAEYLDKRNLTKEIRDKYKIGYAFKDGKATIDFLKSRGHSLKTIEDTGVSAMMNGAYFDKNQGRAIFPICDKDGNVIGYSARRIHDTDEAKYVNSPETYLFHKSSVLYNYHIAKEAARIKGCVYVCEGFMDVFALASIGEDNAVALMGTALTDEHIAMLRNLNVEIRLCLDGDLPGQTAMMKASKKLEEAGLKCLIVDNHGSTKDPDEIINEDGKEALQAYINKLLTRVDFALNYFERSNPLKTNEEKKNLIKQFIPI
ncbi:MAG: DNA primase, partial [Bacilli bacterium]|nr:DNA primase [Bacilli bacterium]